MQTNIGLFLAKRARLEPHKVGVIFEGREITYQEWNERANRAANAFVGLGIQPGDRVGVLLMNTPEFLECFFGLAKIGAMVVPLNWRLAPPELAFIANDAGIRALVYGAEYASAVAALRGSISAATYVAVGDAPAGDYSYAALTADASAQEPPTVGAADDPLVIMFTAGTTGTPKGATLTHNNLFYDSCTVAMSTDWRWNDRVLVALPLFHIGALIYVVINIHIGATTVLMKAFDPMGFLKTLQDHKVNSFLAVPAMLNFMLQVPTLKDFDLSAVRWALCGTAPVPVPLIQAWAQRGIAIQQVYGLTECSGGAAVLSSERALEKVGSTGLPMFHTDIRVVNLDGNDTQPEEIGEIIIRGPHVMREYWQNPQATAATVREGWLYTGDLGKLDAEGYLYIVERKRDLIISGGENIYPAEVENVLVAMPQIAEVAVIGIPDADWGEAVCAVARLKEGQTLTLEEVVAHCIGKLGKYKIPKQLILSAQPLPRNPTGKMLKRALREKVASGG
ncbi:MAG: Long-chain-fatty-acid--CoA ligase FadD13 [Anaerolineae bacterium]|nr:Long-chain-fatty-acid--CoA ligase FadD13 [Anaerolineae bacterium]